MILPTKRLSESRSLLVVGADILRLLKGPKTVSRLWDEMQKTRSTRSSSVTLTYDWFVLALDLLYTISAIDMEQGLVSRRGR